MKVNCCGKELDMALVARAHIVEANYTNGHTRVLHVQYHNGSGFTQAADRGYDIDAELRRLYEMMKVYTL